MRHFTLAKNKLDELIKFLAKRNKVYAPVRRDAGGFSFEQVASASGISLRYVPTILPPKKYFMPQRETLLRFKNSGPAGGEAVIETEKAVIFGMHTCDLAGMLCLDMVFSESPKDANYLARKENLAIIGLECNDYCDKAASCRLMQAYLPSGGYDIMLTDIGESFVAHVNTQTGADIAGKSGLFAEAGAQDMAELAKVREAKKTLFANEVNVEPETLPGIFARSAGHPVWEDLGRRCLACGNCTNVCPTCYCFDVQDKVELDMASGERIRKWDSCQNKPFAEVAGGENFRPERSQRQRHRYYRKFKFPYDKYKRFFCTGCGRCTRACMAGISLKETLRALAEGK